MEMRPFIEHWREIGFGLLGIALITASVALPPLTLEGSEVEELRQHIQDRQNKITNLEKEIRQFEQQVAQTSKEADSIAQKIAELRASKNKLTAEINVARNQIEAKEYTLDKLSLEINDVEARMAIHRDAIADTLRKIDEEDNTTTLEAILLYDSISGLWDRIETLERLQESARTRVSELADLREELGEKRHETVQTKEELERWQENLADKKTILESSEREQAQVLGAARSEEEQYRAILEEKKRQREAFTKELNKLESQLQIAIDPSKFPERGTSVFTSPVPDLSLRSCWDGGGSASNCVTQYFGNTSFSQRTAAYNGNGHNGLDLRTSVGTPISAPLRGVVKAVGNTDAYAGCYSYGKWILLEHPNGLSTLYAHLSLIKVVQGQAVNTGDVIGYSGNTGFSTGPHLHFTVYATEGVRVVQYTNSNNCKQATIPIADQNAYLNPLDYL